MSSDQPITSQLRDGVAIVTIDDGKANALNGALIDQLSAALDTAETNASAVVITGRPGRFSAGFDLSVMRAGAQAVRDLVAAGGDLFLRLYALPLPVVMAVSGHALAGGVLLAAAGDLRIGVEGPFKIGLNEVQNGMAVPILAHELARDRLDPRALTAAVLHSKIYDPAGAVAAGWLDEVVAPEALEATALAAAARLGKLPRRAYALTKRSLRGASIDHMRATLRANLEAITSAAGGL